MSKNNNKRKEIEQDLEKIIENAATKTNERISKDITLAQAASIRYRSIQLVKEGQNYHGISPNKKAQEISECWKQKEVRK